MAYPHGLSPDTVKRGQSILDDKNLSIGEVKDNFLEFLEGQNLVQKGVLHTDMSLTHPKNRGSLLLNPTMLIATAHSFVASVQTSANSTMRFAWRCRQIQYGGRSFKS